MRILGFQKIQKNLRLRYKSDAISVTFETDVSTLCKLKVGVMEPELNILRISFAFAIAILLSGKIATKTLSFSGLIPIL